MLYGGVDLSQRHFTPDAASRLPGNTVPLSAAAWMVGDLAGSTGDSAIFDLHYVSSKSALIGLTRSLAREVGEHNIAVNAVAPEFITHDPEVATKYGALEDMVVASRVFKRKQTPEDMVGTILFLSRSELIRPRTRSPRRQGVGEPARALCAERGVLDAVLGRR